MKLTTRQGGVRTVLEQQLPDRALSVAWLGQAGFALRYQNLKMLIDPYLSDYLSNKYRGQEFPHIRMTPSPIDPADVRKLDFVLCTHRHSDHMDPDSLAILAKHNPKCRFVVPQAERKTAESLGLPRARTLLVDADEVHPLTEDVHLKVVPAAHEELKRNAEGSHHFLGFVLRFPIGVLYHSGDTIPYQGLEERLGFDSIDLALLPVNGRDAYRKARGVPGNMTLEEAHALCQSLNIPWMVPHHFEMFEFNTIERKHLEQKIDVLRSPPCCVLPTTGQHWVLT